MENQSKLSFSDKFFKIVKNLFWLLLLINIIPTFFSSFRENLQNSAFPKEHVGFISLKGGLNDSMFYTRQIRAFEANASIKAILIKCNCPGGAPGSSQALFSELDRCKKPIVMYVENVCASGAYYAALAADQIIANPSAILGSIGVVMSLPDVKGLLDNWQVNINYVHAGKYKVVGAATQHLTDEQQRYLQNLVDDSYIQFVEDVARKRSLKLEDQELWANGKIFTGRQALELKLIDSVGSLSDALDAIKALAHIEGDVKLISPKKPSPIMAALSGQDADEVDSPELGTQLGQFLSSTYRSFCAHQIKSTHLQLD